MLPNKTYGHYGTRETWDWVWALAFTSCVAWSDYFISLSLSFHIYKFKVAIGPIEKTSPVEKSLFSADRLPTLKSWLHSLLAVRLEQLNFPVPQFPLL